jgi:hypothetical protein
MSRPSDGPVAPTMTPGSSRVKAARPPFRDTGRGAGSHPLRGDAGPSTAYRPGGKQSTGPGVRTRRISDSADPLRSCALIAALALPNRSALTETRPALAPGSWRTSSVGAFPRFQRRLVHPLAKERRRQLRLARLRLTRHEGASIQYLATARPGCMKHKQI